MRYQPVRVADIATHPGLGDWRTLLDRLHGRFRVPGFAAAAHLVSQIARVADDADHHPDVDLRFPGTVHVAITTHATRGLSDADVSLALAISGLAREAGAVADPSGLQSIELAIDAADGSAIAPFWAAVLGYVERDGSLHDPAGLGPSLWFQQMHPVRIERGRVHLDVTVPHDQAEARVAAALAAGGHLVSDANARSWWVLADAEGNEACVSTWLDRD